MKHIELLSSTTVEARNKLQNSGIVIPYTCGSSDCKEKNNCSPLRATEYGWICDHCGYLQKSINMKVKNIKTYEIKKVKERKKAVIHYYKYMNREGEQIKND